MRLSPTSAPGGGAGGAALHSIAPVGLAAQTGIVMIVYIDNAFERRRRAGKIRHLSDIVLAHMEGTVQRVPPSS